MSAAASEQVVRDFCGAWEDMDERRVLQLLAEDVFYQNVPRPPFLGREAVAAFIAPIFRDASRVEFELLAIAVSTNGQSVLTERVDRLHYTGGVVEIPLMGIFEVREDGRIQAWRDYPDSAHVARQVEQVRSGG